MKRLVPFIFLMIICVGVSAQYQGQPWKGAPWGFGQDTVANLSLGKDYSHQRGTYNGIPHYLFDIGKVDTLARPSDDLLGTLVAGVGIDVNDAGRDFTFRLDASTTEAKTLDESDIAAINSPFYGGAFRSNRNRALIDRGGGWYRYTTTFEPGNYHMMLRSVSLTGPNLAFWIRFYDKATMEPLYPWTRFHGSSEDPEGLSLLDVNTPPWNTMVSSPGNLPGASHWVVSLDEFSLSGEVVFEFVDGGPSLDDYGNVAGANGVLGEISFIYAGTQSDKFAPVIEPWRTSYDEMDELDMTLSEEGTFYIIPAGTLEEEIETTYIEKVEMTTQDNYKKDVSEFINQGIDSVQYFTKDAAGNTRITSTIVYRNIIIPDTVAGNQGDFLGMNVSRAGIVFLAPKEIPNDFATLMAAVAAGNADTTHVTGGRDTLHIQNLSGNMDLKLVLYKEVGAFSNPVDFKLGEGGTTSVPEREEVKVTVFVDRGTIFLNHNGAFEELFIYDVLGKQWIHQKVNSNNMTINASDLTDGVYFYRLHGRNSGVSTGKLLINKY